MQGLTDIQEFVIRKDLLEKQKYVGIEELMYREDIAQIWDGIDILFNTSIDFFYLLKTVK